VVILPLKQLEVAYNDFQPMQYAICLESLSCHSVAYSLPVWI